MSMYDHSDDDFLAAAYAAAADLLTADELVWL